MASIIEQLKEKSNAEEGKTMIEYYREKKTGEIIKAEPYEEGMEVGFGCEKLKNKVLDPIKCCKCKHLKPYMIYLNSSIFVDKGYRLVKLKGGYAPISPQELEKDYDMLADSSHENGHAYIPTEQEIRLQKQAADYSELENVKRNGDGLTFSEALDLLKNGHAVARQGWNGKGMFVFMNPEHECNCFGEFTKEETVKIEPHFYIKNVKGTLNSWVPSSSDLLAEDWTLVILDESKVEGVK